MPAINKLKFHPHYYLHIHQKKCKILKNFQIKTNRFNRFKLNNRSKANSCKIRKNLLHSNYLSQIKLLVKI